MLSPDDATIRSLRTDVALQIARFVARSGISQLAAAKQLGIPQPTMSKIANGRVTDISLELLIRIAVRTGVPMTLLTGHGPEEAGAFVAGTSNSSLRALRSTLADAARESLVQSQRRLTPSQRLEAFLEHNQLLCALHESGRAAKLERARVANRVP